jgi:hypothetical protein
MLKVMLRPKWAEAQAILMVGREALRLTGPAQGIMRPGVVQKNEAFYLYKKKKKKEKLLYIRFLL